MNLANELCFSGGFSRVFRNLAIDLGETESESSRLDRDLFARTFSPNVIRDIPGPDQFVQFKQNVRVGAGSTLGKTTGVKQESSRLISAINALIVCLQNMQVAGSGLITKTLVNSVDLTKEFPQFKELLETIKQKLSSLPTLMKGITSYKIFDRGLGNLNVTEFLRVLRLGNFEFKHGRMTVKDGIKVWHNGARPKGDHIAAIDRDIGLSAQHFLILLDQLIIFRDLVVEQLQDLGEHVKPLINALKVAKKPA